MKTTYKAEMYSRKGERKFVEVEASPAELERIANGLLRDTRYDGVRFLREVSKPQVVEILHYRKKESGKIRAVWRDIE